ncbi:hypothetical protein SNE40_001511 [Patella caerulea]
MLEPIPTSENENYGNYEYYDDSGYEDFNYGDFNYEDFNYEDFINNSDAYIFTDDSNDTSFIEVEQQLEKFIVPVVFMFIFIVGSIGNSIVIYIVMRRPDMRTVTNLYLANLAAIDLLYLLVCVPLTSAGFALTYWPFGLFLCRFVNYVQSVSLAISVLTLTATSVDRYYAIIHPVRSRTTRTSRRAQTVICIIWCISLVVMIPRIFIYHQEEYFLVLQTRMFCMRKSDNLGHKQIDTLVMFITMFLLPQIFLGTFHVRIIKQLWTSVRPGFRPNDIALSGLRTRRKIAKIIFAITIAFGVGWLPIHIIYLYEDFTGSGDTLIFRKREVFALCFSYGANSVNPIIYTLISGKFRNHFKSVLLCCYSRESNRTVADMPELVGDVSPEVVPLRQEYVNPANKVTLPQPRDQILIYPVPSSSFPGSTFRPCDVLTVGLDRSLTTDDLTTIV